MWHCGSEKWKTLQDCQASPAVVANPCVVPPQRPRTAGWDWWICRFNPGYWKNLWGLSSTKLEAKEPKNPLTKNEYYRQMSSYKLPNQAEVCYFGIVWWPVLLTRGLFTWRKRRNAIWRGMQTPNSRRDLTLLWHLMHACWGNRSMLWIWWWLQDVRGEVTGVVIPVLAALAGWLATMYGIQHSLIELPFLSGTRMPVSAG